jgi:hypothetical protein
MRLFLFFAVPTLAALSASISSVAAAEDAGFDASAAGGAITVVAHPGFHINKEFPWKVAIGDKKVGKEGFTLEEGKAIVGGLPKGHAVLKGAVCKGAEGNSSACLPFTKELDL